MQFLALIYDSESQFDAQPEDWKTQNMQAWMDYDQHVKDAGISVSGEALMPVSTAKSVRVTDGKIVATDGPFAETKEQLGGYYVFECKDVEEAIHYASKMPAAETGTIEIRPIMVLDQ